MIVGRADRSFLMLRWVDPATGRVCERSSKTRVRREAERAAARLEDEIASGKSVASLAITWEAFGDAYEERKLKSLSDGSRERWQTVTNSLDEFTKIRRLAELTSARIGGWQAWLRERHVAEATIGSYTRTLLAALKWAEKHCMLRAAPAADIPKKGSGRGVRLMKGRPLRDDELPKLLAAVPKAVAPDEPFDAVYADDSIVGQWRRYLRGLWLSGLRLEESTILSWDAGELLTIELTGRHPRFRFLAESHKSDRDELLPMTPDFAEFILSTPESEREGLVFPIASEYWTAQKTVAKIGRTAEVATDKKAGRFASAHDFRRTFGTRWAKRVMPALLQKLMRHASITTTMAYYVDIDADDIADELWKPK